MSKRRPTPSKVTSWSRITTVSNSSAVTCRCLTRELRGCSLVCCFEDFHAFELELCGQHNDQSDTPQHLVGNAHRGIRFLVVIASFLLRQPLTVPSLGPIPIGNACSHWPVHVP